MDGLFNDGGGFNQLLLGDDEWRGNPDQVPAHGLGQQAVVPQLQAYVMSIDICTWETRVGYGDCMVPHTHIHHADCHVMKAMSKATNKHSIYM